MNREANERLRLDRRLMHRPRWISKADLERELEALPDVSHKVAPPDEAEAASEGAAAKAAGDPAGDPQPAQAE